MLLLLQFLRYRDAVCGILRTTKLATKRWEQIFEFSPQNFLEPPKVKKKNLKKKFLLWKALKNLGGKN